MFGRHYFGGRYFAPRYFGDGGSGEPEPSGPSLFVSVVLRRRRLWWFW